MTRPDRDAGDLAADARACRALWVAVAEIALADAARDPAAARDRLHRALATVPTLRRSAGNR